MKKIILVLIAMLSFSCAFADDKTTDNTTFGTLQTNSTEESEAIWDRERDDSIRKDYGSEFSPAFSNRENIDIDQGDGDYDYDYDSADSYE